MKVKSKEELLKLDEELNIFNEDAWDFLDVQNGESLEYFNDIQDVDFARKNLEEVLRYTFLVLLTCTILLISGVWLYDVTVGRYILTEEDADSTNDVIVKLKRVDGGEQASNSDYIEISKVMSSYFSILQHKNSYNVLNNFCLLQSNFYETEKLYRDKMKYAYDSNDCYSRALRCFGSYFSVSKINEILYKDDVYYVYLDLNCPDNDALTEYFYIYGADLSKFFNTNDITEQNIIKCLVMLSDTYGLPTSNTEVCLEFCKKDGEFVLMDDSSITSKCTGAYNHAISQVVKILGVSKVSIQYD